MIDKRKINFLQFLIKFPSSNGVQLFFKLRKEFICLGALITIRHTSLLFRAVPVNFSSSLFGWQPPSPARIDSVSTSSDVTLDFHWHVWQFGWCSYPLDWCLTRRPFRFEKSVVHGFLMPLILAGIEKMRSHLGYRHFNWRSYHGVSRIDFCI